MKSIQETGSTALAMPIQVSQFDPGEGQAWDNFVMNVPGSSHSHLSGWAGVIERSYGHKACYLWAFENGEIQGILPLVQFRSLSLKTSLVSLPFLDEGGICVRGAVVAQALFEEAARLYQQQGAQVLDLRHRTPNQLPLPCHGSKVTLVLGLSENPTTIWDSFNAKVRNQVRKAQKADLKVAWVGIEGLEEFYQVFAINMRDLGSPVHSLKFFAEVLQEFPDSAKLILVRKGSEVIGGGLCLQHQDTFSIPWASSLRSYRNICPNNLLYWEAIRVACEEGLSRFDFGRSSVGSGTFRFKKQWGAQEEPLHWQCLAKDVSQVSMVQADNPQLQWVIRVWQSLPLSVTKGLGPWLRGRLSN